MVVILDTSIVNVALGSIADALATDTAGLQWDVNAYTLSFASLLLTGGALGDRLGAKNVYFAGLAVFTLASALCGLAPNLAALTGARVFQGIGASMLVPCSLMLINRAYTDRAERSRAIGLWAGCGGVAMAGGPLVGGFLIHVFGWRSIFLANLPIGVIGFWVGTGAGDAASRPRRSGHSNPGFGHLDRGTDRRVFVWMAVAVDLERDRCERA